MCLITSAPPEDPVIHKKVIYTDAPRRSTSHYDPSPRTAYSPRSSVTRTVYTEPVSGSTRSRTKERSYANGSYGDLDRERSVVERRSYAGSYSGSRSELERREVGGYRGSEYGGGYGSERGGYPRSVGGYPDMGGSRERVGSVYVERPRGSSQASVVIVDETVPGGGVRRIY